MLLSPQIIRCHRQPLASLCELDAVYQPQAATKNANSGDHFTSAPPCVWFGGEKKRIAASSGSVKQCSSVVLFLEEYNDGANGA
jgi:hypothetical protein